MPEETIALSGAAESLPSLSELIQTPMLLQTPADAALTFCMEAVWD